jgi:hypothetical protein
MNHEIWDLIEGKDIVGSRVCGKTKTQAVWTHTKKESGAHNKKNLELETSRGETKN